MTLLYQVEFFTYWHTSSGLSAGTDTNLVVRKDQNELPFIPGKTLKGLLREAAEKLNHLDKQLVTDDFVINVFGMGDDQVVKEHNSNSGVCFFSNAKMSENLIESIDEQQIDFLYAKIASTAIDQNGIAKKHSLRKMEVTIPLTLYAVIEDFPQKYLSNIESCFQWVKRLGMNRTRGLGRCKFSILKPNQYEAPTV